MTSVGLFCVFLIAGLPGATTVESSRECTRCHPDAVAVWQLSMHARSLSEPHFQDQFKKVEQPEDRRLCLGCHAPLSLYDNDPELAKPTTREGVTCDFCHSVVRLLPIRFDQQLRFVLAPGDIKRGPYAASELVEKEHKNLGSPIYHDSAFCAGCHEVVNRLGLHVMSTYSEWSQSSYASQRINCQNCHMPQDIRFPLVDPSIVSTPRTMTSHSMLGGHSALQLRGAGTLALRAYPTATGIEAVVDVTNAEAGHYLPTGLPARKLALKVTLLDGKDEPIQSKSVEYKRVLGDTRGRPIPPDEITRLFLQSSSVTEDTRIPPKATRQERFRFELTPLRRPVTAVASLDYAFEPEREDRPLPSLRLAEQRVEIPAGPAAGRYALLALIILVLAGTFWFVARRRQSAVR